MSTKGSDFFESVEDFVSFSGGDHAIKKILIANNGIGATKAIRSIRRWSFETFGNERIIKFVVMATPEDMRANAEYIRMADEVVDVPGGSNNNNYANINLICQIADRLKVDAVMPMWGHASENPALPTSLLKLSHKVTFIGPAAEPMQALGDKIGSTIIAQSAGVPTIAWNGDGLTVDYKATGIPQSVYDEANVTCAEDALTCCERIGYPVMIKASEGGGGKGIRKVLRSEDVLSLYRQVQGEIPGSPIFVMKMASKARHLEVQLIADKYGEAIALSGRDCSVQRRHQKIIEEGPPIAAPLDVFKRMEQAAVALAKTVGYCNAGTVEYLYLEETQKFAFLELNPRLQVEHPVTENILGLNLPSCQLQVAMGVPLHRIGDIRKMYGRHPRGRDTIDFEFSEKVPNPRHCIAVRVTAENPEAGFQPTSGIIKELHFHSAIDVWGYFSVDNSGLIHEFADSQFGHIFASGKDRESARRAMIVALKELQIRGDIRTTIEYIIKMLQSADFVANRIDTDWLDGRIANHKAISIAESNLYCPPATLVATCGAALQGYKNFKQRDADFINMLKVGQVPTKDSLLPAVSVDLIYENVKFKTRCTQCGNEKVIVTCNEGSQNIGIRTLSDGGYLLNIGGQSHVAYSTEESGGSIRMILDGHTCIFTPEYDPTVLTSTVAGKLARLLVEDGSHVNAGEPFVEIEVMKMYMSLKALEAGTVHFQMSEGATLIPGDVIATVRLDKPDSVVNSEEFKGQLFVTDGTVLVAKAEDSPQIKLRESLQDIEKVLQGFPVTDAEITAIINNYIASLKDGLLPACKVEESLSVLRGRIDAEVAATIADLNDKYKQSVLNGFAVKYPAAKILMTLQSFAQSLPIEKRAAFNSQVSELWSTVEPFIFSTDEIILASLVRFLEAYLDVERQFDNMSFTDVVNQLRKDNPNELEKVLQLCRSHVNIKAKNVVLLQVIDLIKSYPAYATIKRPEIPLGLVIRNEIHTRRIKGRLGDLAKLRQPIYSHVSFAANLLLIDQFNLTVENRRQRLNESIISALTTGDPIGQGDRVTEMKKFIDSNIVFRDILIDSLRHDKDYQIAVMELYLRKTYQKTHDLINFACGTSLSGDGSDMNSWVTFEFMTTSVEAVVDTTSSTAETTGITKSISFTDLMTYSRQSALTEGDETNRDSLSSASSDTFKNPIVPGLRNGVFALIESFAELPALFPLVAAKIPNHGHNAMSVNAIHVAILSGPATCNSADEVSAFLSQFLATQSENLNSRCIRRVTFFVDNRSSTRKSAMPTIFTFRSRNAFQEDRLFRHIEAPHAFHLDLPRLSNFSIKLEEGVQTYSGNVHLYKAVPKTGKGPRRYFARLVSFTADILGSDFESLFVEALDHLALVLGHEEALDKNFRANNTAANHIFINVVSPDSVIQPDSYDLLLRNMSTKYWYKMVRLAITTVELKLTCRLAVDSEPLFIRLVASNPTGFVLKIDKYFEAFVNGKTVFKSVTRSKGPWDGLDTTTPYDISQKFENQRAEAMAASDTLYVYDWPLLFENATEKQWLDYQKDRKVAECAAPENFFHCRELVMCDSETRAPLAKGWTAKHGEVHGIMRPVDRDAGMNDAGMVAWHMTLRTPECPEGRELVVICNDITFQAGSFGTKEDIIFFKASEYARQHGLPRLFLTANSGARIGMAQSLKSKFQVCWQDDKDPSKGFKYIYINDADYQELLVKAKGDVAALPVVCSETVNADGETRHLITDIIGEEPDLGVENLMGSGLIAGETARAYDEIFTLTMVVGRTVGIGAYLVRLGQRTIQKTRNAPIILTGYQALNKLMGREIYTTNDQLGGPMIMFPNGVSHLLAETHLEVVSRALDWLSFVPAVKNGPLPIRDIVGVDSVERLVHFTPQKGLTYDPRLLFCGLKLTKEESSWKSGFFDKNSFVETLSGWAKTVVVGRGRLGGIPMGVIVTENRTAEATKPADPADLTSQEKLVQQAGGVWFPDSAYKTAQALRDFNREGLPCIIFANWRGFSGGQRDMFDEVLKFGSMIVDALVAYQQPLFVYIPPFAELRGGAWVVVDSTINADVMEFYAAEDARGGVLEAAGAASIKFRDRDIVQTAHRIDPVLIDLDAKLLEAKASGASAADVEALSKQIAHRERMLFGVYQQVAVHFADLHDTPGRMKAKGVIRRKVQWAESRKFFYWRLRRRLLEFDVASQLLVRRAEKAVDHRKKVVADLQQWFLEQGGSAEQWEDDKHMMHWFESHKADLNDYVAAIKNGLLVIQIGQKIADVVQAATSDSESPEEASLFLKQAFLTLSPEDRAQLLAALKD